MDNHSPNPKAFILPCILTCASLFSGFYSIVAAIKGNFLAAAYAILVAGIFDGLDGRVARLTGGTSKFGKELDSLCDLVSFGVAPALLAYLWALQPFNRYGWLAAFLYVATTALRLARFNTQSSGSHDFIGLPCPAAAGMIATTVMFSTALGAADATKRLPVLVLVYFLSYLMVSTHRYRSFKQPDLLNKVKSFQIIVGIILLITLLATEPPITLFVVTTLYIASGPILAVYDRLAEQRKKVQEKSSLS